MAPITVGGLTVSYQPGGERGLGMIRFETTAATGPHTVRLALPRGAEHNKAAKAAGRVHFRQRFSDASRVTRLYYGLAQQGGADHYHLLKMIEYGADQTIGVSRCGVTDPAYAAAWNGQWRTIIGCSDKKIVVGSPTTWDRTNRYLDDIDGLVVTIRTSGAMTMDLDCVYSPEWSVGAVVDIFDGAYGDAIDLAMDAYGRRGWHFGCSANRVDGAVTGGIRYPDFARLRQIAQAGHDVFAHGHYLSAGSPVPMTSAVTEDEALEILSAQRAAIAGAVGADARGLIFSQWLQNKGPQGVEDIAGSLRSMGVRFGRGDCTDARWGINPFNSARVSTWATAPATQTGGRVCGWTPEMGPFNLEYMEWFGGSTPLARDTYAGSTFANCVEYAANCKELILGYTHDIDDYDGVNPTANNSGRRFWLDQLAHRDELVAAGKIVVLSLSELWANTYGREGPIYMRWDGEWVNREDGSIAA